MGRTVFAEETVLGYLKSLGNTTDAYTVGLILGQSIDQKDFVVHLARTLPTATDDVVEETLLKTSSKVSQHNSDNYIESIKDIDVNLVSDHAKQVTTMLPGGMHVLGIFVIGSGDCLSDNSCSRKLISVLSAVHKILASNVYLYGNSKHENLILSFNSSTEQYVCKSVDIGSAGILKPADWKFQKKAMKWHQLESLIDLDNIFPIVDETNTLKRQLQNIVEKISDMIHSALVIIEGEAKEPEELLESLYQKKKTKKNDDEDEHKILQVGVYLPCAAKDQQENVKVVSCSASMKLMGQLVSRTVLHQKATIEEAVKAVKQDIIRSLASRLELHWDSVIEEENGSPEENITLHEPPRRVLVELPHSKITLSHYLFPGEGTQEPLRLLKELLDLEISESNFQRDVERQVDPSEFYSQNEVQTGPVDLGKETATGSRLTLWVAGSVAVVIIAIIITLILQLYSGKRH